MPDARLELERVRQQLVRVEEAQLFDQRTLEQLNELVLRLGESVDRIEARVRALEARLEARESGDGVEGEMPEGDSDPFGRRSEPT